MSARWSDEQRAEALRLYEAGTLAEAARATGVPKSTIRTWAAAAGVRTFGTEQTRAATEARAVDLEARRAALAVALYDEAERSLADLDAPVAVYAMTRDGLGTGTAPRPNPRDRQARVVAVAVLLDKAQLLAGKPTERTDTGGLDLEEVMAEARAEKRELQRLRALHAEDDDGPDDALRAV